MTRPLVIPLIRLDPNDTYVEDKYGWCSNACFATCPELTTELIVPTPSNRKPLRKASLDILSTSVDFFTEKSAIRERGEHCYQYYYDNVVIRAKPKYDEALALFATSFSVARMRNSSHGDDKVVIYRDRKGVPIAICMASTVRLVEPLLF